MMIKNKTPYVGKIKLKFEKYPHYTGRSVLNKVHINLGFTKLVSRMYPKRTKYGWVVDTYKLRLIENFTGGIVDEHWVDKRQPKEEFTLHNSFLSKDGTYIGDIEMGWWYYENNFKVCNDYPHGVAEVWGSGELKSYYGYTHRGGSYFTINDRLFDENWLPSIIDIKTKWVDDYEEFSNTKLEGFDQEIIGKLISYIPFKERGDIVIKTMEEAKQAAINLSKYLS